MNAVAALLGLRAVWQVETLMTVAAQVTLIGMAACGLAYASRRYDARDMVLRSGVVALLILPLVAAAIPSYHVTVTLPGFMSQMDNAVVLTGWRSDIARLIGASPSASPARVMPGPGVYAWILAVWLVGALTLASRLTMGALRLRALARAARPVTGGRLRTFEMLKPVGAARRDVRLLESDAFAVPATYGWRRPVIVLPASSIEWSDDRLRAVLSHELAHVSRRDAFWQVASVITCAMYWFHPVIWWAARLQRHNAELQCDREALARGTPRVSYARLLVEMTQSGALRPAPLGALPFIGRSDLESRVRQLLRPASRPVGRWGRVVFVALLFGLAIPAMSLQLSSHLCGCRSAAVRSAAADSN